MPFGHLKLLHLEMRLISFLNLHICLYTQKIPVLKNRSDILDWIQENDQISGFFFFIEKWLIYLNFFYFSSTI